jgi:SAM-dependent methyltransferase
MPDPVIDPVAAFFSAKLAEHGPTPRGVDWNSAVAQEVRFDALLRVVDEPRRPFSLLDYGCGYGSLAGHMSAQGYDGTYVGYDVSTTMVEAAGRASAGPGRSFTADAAALVPVDYVVASGIFNIKLDATESAWLAHMEGLVEAMDRLARRGFAFNALTSYADRRRTDLFYADPLYWFDRCRRRYARRVALLHDYDPWDFTIVVRKDA